MIPAAYVKLAEGLALVALAAALLYGFNRFCDSQRDIGRAEVQALWDRQKATDAETARQRSEFNQKVVDTALTQGAQREATIKTLSAGAAAANASLRDTVAAFSRSNSTATVETLINRANTAGALLGDCSERYRGMAEKADRHANDARTLSDAWPTK